MTLSLATVLAAISARAQEAPVLQVSGHPSRIATLGALADARTFAVARAGDRAVIAYVQAFESSTRGTLRLALVRALADHAGLERVGTDRTLAPSAFAVSVAWNGTRGAVVYTVPRPHRGEVPGTHRQRPGSTERALADPLGSSALTAADVMFQAIDEQGGPVGRPVLLFEENSRAFRTAVAADGDGWFVAWTGGITSDGGIEGTVRSIRVAANARVPSYASDTGFVGQVGDALRIVPAEHGRRDAMVVWSGERCAAREGAPDWHPSTSDPSAEAGVRPGEQRNQHLPNETIGPPIECQPRRLHLAPVHPDGTSAAVEAGPLLAADSFAIVDAGGEAPRALAPLLAEHAQLASIDIDPHGRFGTVRTWIDPPRPAPTSDASSTPEDPPASVITPSRVPPPIPPAAEGITAAPGMLDAAADRDNVAALALSPTRARVAFARFPHHGADRGSLTLFATPSPITDVALAGDPHDGAWLFVQTGGNMGGPITFVDPDAPATHAAPDETVWLGDERFRQHLLRARAARAAYTAGWDVYGPLSERPDAPTNPRLPGLDAELRRLRARWESACGPLEERARFLARHGVDATVVDLAREQCEYPLPPGTPAPADAAPGAP